MKPWIVSFAAGLAMAAPAWAQAHGHEPAPPAQEAPADPHAGHAPPADPHAGHVMSGRIEHRATMSSGVFGAYPMARDASGTSWQPDVSTHEGIMLHRDGWMLMGHALLNGVYSWQEGPRGDEKAFFSGMAMGSARRDFGRGTLNLRAMLSPDPFMGRSGYPLLFAAGETADGQNELVDRQHPHDLFMELSASYARRFDNGASVFIYGGLPGEPAFGPPAFMHRLSNMDSPEAPITHHWLDSTHITFGVVTLGYVQGPFKIEASRFRGREPDEDRYDIETGELDSTSVRLSLNPTENLALQVSWADVTSPEQLHPEEDETRWSASAIYARRIGEGLWSTTLAYGSKEHEGGHPHGAWLVESAYALRERWTFFARGEAIETEALGPGEHEVSRLSVGAVRDVRVAPHARLGIGAVLQQHFAPAELEPAYDGDPMGALAFVRLKIG